MELSEALAFARVRRNGVVATVQRDGRPHLSNIVYTTGADDVIRISVTAGRAKTKNLQRDPRASLYVPGDSFWSWIVLEGTAELTPVAAAPDDPTTEELIDVYRAVAGEHDDWDAYRRAMVDDRRLVVRLRAEHAYGMSG